MEDTGYYKQLPYRIEITQDLETKLYRAEFPDLPGCHATGSTIDRAIRSAEARKAEWFSKGSHDNKDHEEKYYATHDHDMIDEYMKDRIPLRVAAYIRESVPNNGLRSPLVLQQKLFETEITGHPGWIFAGTFIDKGQGQQLKNRPGLLSLISECESGNIDVIICRNISRLFRFVPDVIKLTNHLKELDPPVGVYFEAEATFSLSAEDLEK